MFWLLSKCRLFWTCLLQIFLSSILVMHGCFKTEIIMAWPYVLAASSPKLRIGMGCNFLSAGKRGNINALLRWSVEKQMELLLPIRFQDWMDLLTVFQDTHKKNVTYIYQQASRILYKLESPLKNSRPAKWKKIK